jgi:radical SAM superfamily enzyme YgiQ (UPF0313 family)
MKILLLNPPALGSGWYKLEHLGLGYIAAVLRQDGHHVVILDANLEGWNPDQARRATAGLGPFDVVGLTGMGPETFLAGLDLIAQSGMVARGGKVIAGGYFATFWGEKILALYPQIDAIVLGEGEQTVVELVRALGVGRPLQEVAGVMFRAGNETFCALPRPLIGDLDQLPFPARDYARQSYEQNHLTGIYGSRGCCHKCTFCQISQFYRLAPGSIYRTRSAGNIVAEMQSLVDNYGIRNFLFVDDEFIEGSRRRTQVIGDFTTALRQKSLDVGFAVQYRADQGHRRDLLAALKAVGLTTVFIGVESGIDSVLARYNKGITRHTINNALSVARELDLSLIVGYILYDPYTTFDELRANVAYLRSDEAPTVLDLHGLIVLKGTTDETRLRKEGRLKEDGFRLYYRAIDDDVQAFKQLLFQYESFSSPSIGNIYRLQLMTGRFPAQTRRDSLQLVGALLNQLRGLHNTFLGQAEADVMRGRDGHAWMGELCEAHAELAAESGRLIASWESALTGR